MLTLDTPEICAVVIDFSEHAMELSSMRRDRETERGKKDGERQ